MKSIFTLLFLFSVIYCTAQRVNSNDSLQIQIDQINSNLIKSSKSLRKFDGQMTAGLGMMVLGGGALYLGADADRKAITTIGIGAFVIGGIMTITASGHVSRAAKLLTRGITIPLNKSEGPRKSIKQIKEEQRQKPTQ